MAGTLRDFWVHNRVGGLVCAPDALGDRSKGGTSARTVHQTKNDKPATLTRQGGKTYDGLQSSLPNHVSVSFYVLCRTCPFTFAVRTHAPSSPNDTIDSSPTFNLSFVFLTIAALFYISDITT